MVIGMKKDFYEWHTIKQDIQAFNQRWFYHEREVRWCSMGLNVGFETDGKGENYRRPVLILRGFSRETCLCVPLTTREKSGIYSYPLDLRDGISRNVMLSQARCIDTKRLRESIGVVDQEQFRKIKQALIDIIQ
jgi:mRNA interferase MazF